MLTYGYISHEWFTRQMHTSTHNRNSNYTCSRTQAGQYSPHWVWGRCSVGPGTWPVTAQSCQLVCPTGRTLVYNMANEPFAIGFLLLFIVIVQYPFGINWHHVRLLACALCVGDQESARSVYALVPHGARVHTSITQEGCQHAAGIYVETQMVWLWDHTMATKHWLLVGTKTKQRQKDSLFRVITLKSDWNFLDPKFQINSSSSPPSGPPPGLLRCTPASVQTALNAFDLFIVNER